MYYYQAVHYFQSHNNLRISAFSVLNCSTISLLNVIIKKFNELIKQLF